MRQVPYVNFPAQYEEEGDEIRSTIDAVFRRGEFVGGAAIDTSSTIGACAVPSR